MDKIKYCVIGAGVVGLAVAENLSRDPSNETIVLEKNDSFGMETSSRNSEVIHAGIYYPLNTLKSKLCLRGNQLLYEYCQKNGVKHQTCGKLIVSTDEDEKREIEGIYNNAAVIGVPGLELLEGKTAQEMEPNVSALNAIYSRTTGIIDSHGLMKKLQQEGADRGTIYSFNNAVIGIEKKTEGYLIKTTQKDEISAEKVINCAGLYSDQIAALVGLHNYRLFPCKGDYFSVKGAKGKLSRLVYPVPHAQRHGLGVHATLALDGQIRLGPDTEYISKLSYDIDPAKKSSFHEAARKYLPWLEENMLSPDTSGIRPKLQGPDDGFVDFVIKDEADSGFPGFINLIGIESPGLTACLAIADYVSKLLGVL